MGDGSPWGRGCARIGGSSAEGEIAMSDATLFYMPATELAERVRRRELSPVAVVRAFLDRIAAVDGDLGAYCTVTAEQALDEARAAEAVLAAGGADRAAAWGAGLDQGPGLYAGGADDARLGDLCRLGAG